MGNSTTPKYVLIDLFKENAGVAWAGNSTTPKYVQSSQSPVCSYKSYRQQLMIMNMNSSNHDLIYTSFGRLNKKTTSSVAWSLFLLMYSLYS